MDKIKNYSEDTYFFTKCSQNGKQYRNSVDFPCNQYFIIEIFQIFLKPTLLFCSLLLCLLTMIQLSPFNSCNLWKYLSNLSQYIILKYIAFGDIISVLILILFWIHKTFIPLLSLNGMRNSFEKGFLFCNYLFLWSLFFIIRFNLEYLIYGVIFIFI